jgi:tetratricopeptide (TPR) repeat protein
LKPVFIANAKLSGRPKNEIKQNPDQTAAAQASLQVLREVQTKDSWGADGQINLKLGEAYRILEQYMEAKRCAENARLDADTTEDGQKLLSLIDEDRQITEIRREFNIYFNLKNYETALEILEKLPEELRQHPDAKKLRDTLLLEAVGSLSESAKQELNRNNIEGMVAAVEAYVRLNFIEDLAGIEKGKGFNRFRVWSRMSCRGWSARSSMS